VIPISSDEGHRQMTIVVAEDESVLRMIAVDFLTEAGFTVIEASHAREAVGVLEVQFQEVHILFTDINMPGEMNGLELARHVRSNWPHIALLVTSGNRSPTAADLPEGSRFLRKPYVRDQVIDHVRSMTAA
jgi:CheY-like chemotaxis protein